MLTDHELRAKARAANRDRAAIHYSWEDVCRKYEQTLQEAMLGEKAIKVDSGKR
jgi:hypothetical protein